MKVLSLFDGMGCAALAMLKANVPIDRYVAFEIDQYAIKTTAHNFPKAEHRGDVFEGDFTEFKGFDILMGGSPCTYWSIAQKNNRETEASGMGWELFSQYVRALKEAQPKYFVYENNKSMSNAIRESITSTFGFEPICINSALLSAQNRQRLYWVGRRNDDGTYSKVEVGQPQDRGILLKDILVNGTAWRDKSYCIDANYFKGGNLTSPKKQSGLRMMAAEPVRIPEYGNPDKARPLNAHYSNNCGGFEHRMFSDNPNKQQVDMVGEPVRVGSLPRPNGELSTSQAFRIYSTEGKSVNINAGGGGCGGKTGLYAIPLKTDIVPFVENKLDKDVEKFGYIPEKWNPYNNAEITDKAPTQTAQCASQTKSSTVLVTEPICFAEPCEWDEDGKPIKAISYADGKVYQVYEVKKGLITIKGKEYPIKLPDGLYIIRKLTVRECMRLQTVQEWFDFSVVSDTQAYKMLGNGWTVDVIAHILTHIPKEGSFNSGLGCMTACEIC